MRTSRFHKLFVVGNIANHTNDVFKFGTLHKPVPALRMSTLRQTAMTIAAVLPHRSCRLSNQRLPARGGRRVRAGEFGDEFGEFGEASSGTPINPNSGTANSGANSGTPTNPTIRFNGNQWVSLFISCLSPGRVSSPKSRSGDRSNSANSGVNATAPIQGNT